MPDDFYRVLNLLLDETITAEQHNQLQKTLLNSPIAQREYFAYLDLHLELRRLIRLPKEEARPSTASLTVNNVTAGKKGRSYRGWSAAGAVFGALLFISIPWVWDQLNPACLDTEKAEIHSSPIAFQTEPPRLTQAANAELFGELLPELNSPLQFDHKYVLYQGVVELTFSNGAQVVLRAPAIFRATTNNRLNLQIGQCSVYAPPGAEGFQVVTPRSEVVDLGTRFSITVDEAGNSDLHVIEGAARIQPKGEPESAVTLSRGDSRRAVEAPKLKRIQFDETSYESRLQDRIVSYEAQQVGAGPAVRDLISVTVQRGGETRVYPVEDLIGIDVVSFVADRARTSLAWEGPFVGDATASLTKDRALNTGLINFGGRTDADAINEGTNTQPKKGLGIRFREPVTNGPGPDVVLFEVQSAIYPPEGDHFWVGPLVMKHGLRIHHVTRFDITMRMAEAKPVAPFHVISFTKTPTSLQDLSPASNKVEKIISLTLQFNALAVGIDLSDLGYGPGEQAEGLFFESDESNSNVIDPVFIGGFPN